MVDRLSLLLLASVLGTGCGAYTVYATPTTLSPNVIPRAPSAQPIAIETSALSSRALCTNDQTALAEVLCIDDLHGVMSRGLAQLLGSYGVPGPSRPDAARAMFTLRALRLVQQGHGVGILAVWQFVLRDAAGRPIVQLAETTVGPETLMAVDGTPAVTTLLNVILERIGNALNAAHWPPEP